MPRNMSACCHEATKRVGTVQQRGVRERDEQMVTAAPIAFVTLRGSEIFPWREGVGLGVGAHCPA